MKLEGLFGRKRQFQGHAEEYQPLVHHLKGVSQLAMEFCSKFHAENWGKVVGLFHDAGKASHDFQLRLQGLLEKVDHATWGARFLYKNISGSVGHVLASIICGHHGGIPNALQGQSKNDPYRTPLLDRLEKDLPVIEEKYIKEFSTQKIGKLKLPQNPFSRFFFSKMVFSSLVDADRLDSELYNSPDKSALRKKYDSLTILRKRMQAKLEEFYRMENPSEIDIIRSEVQKHCYKKAWDWFNPFSWIRNQIFTLTVPTGGGKSFASMLFSLRYAERHHLERVIYVLPYTTIIEQNAHEFRKVLGADNVIEHHCHFEKKSLNYDNHLLRKHWLAVENWDAPVIVTTNVQFFESIYNNGATRSRKLHNIANSVIVFDEAHLLPSRLLKPCVKAIKELIENYNCTAVLCTATQPGLFRDKGFVWGFDKAEELSENPARLYKNLERVQYEFKPNIKTDRQMARLVKGFDKVLSVVNTRRHARILYEDLREQGRHDVYHLSTLMCVYHRRKVLEEVKARLSTPYPCRLISTSLIECGVNITFPVVIRNLCGVGSIIQSGGRCNRNGELGEQKGKLIITNLVGKGHDMNDDFDASSKEIAKKYMRLEKNLFNCDVSQQAFVELFQNMEDRLDKPRGKMPLLKLIQECGRNIPYETISEIFRIIETSAESIIIPYNNEARELLRKLEEDPTDFRIARAIQTYIVQAYPNELEKIAYAIDETSLPPYRILADMSLYSDDYGLRVFDNQSLIDARL
jgi:CRISPR-associated helicase Cas3/CRISPR-associated endonuclease Cas3-HD